MLGDKAGTLTLKETSKPIASGRYGLPAMETHNVGSGKLVGHDVMGRATFTAAMRPDGSWIGECPAGIIACSEGVATFICNGVGNMTVLAVGTAGQKLTIGSGGSPEWSDTFDGGTW